MALKISKENINEQKGFWYGTYTTGIAELHHKNKLLLGVILLLFAFICWKEFRWTRYATALAEKQVLVIETCDGEYSTKFGGDFDNSQKLTEIKGKAKKLIKLMFAVNKESVEKSLEEAALMMRSDYGEKFIKTVAPNYIKEVKASGVYRVIDNIAVRPTEINDLSKENRDEITLYDVVVEGEIDSYENESNKEIKKSGFAFRVRMVPTFRSEDNPSGLLVTSLEPVIKNNESSELSKGVQ